MLKPIKNYPFPEDLKIIGRSMDGSLHPVIVFTPGSTLIVCGLLLMIDNLAFGSVMLIFGLILLILFIVFNHFVSVGKYNENAISYYEEKDLILIQKWKKTYELPFNSIIRVQKRRCFGSNGSKSDYYYARGQKDQTTESWNTDIKK